MALINCPVCRERMSDKATQCPACGASRDTDSADTLARAARELQRGKQRKEQVWRLLAMVVFVAGAGMTVMAGGGKSMPGLVGTSLAAVGFVGYSALRVMSLWSKYR